MLCMAPIMVLDRNIARFAVLAEESLAQALQKITDNRSGLVFVVDHSGVVEGVLTDGDFRRWLVMQTSADLQSAVLLAANRQFVFARDGDNPESIAAKLSDRVKHLPIVDDLGRLVAIASGRAQELTIGRFVLDGHSPAFVIAEIGNNHNGSLDSARLLIDAAKAAGADCAKFQMRNLKKVYRDGSPGAEEDLGAEYTIDLLSRFQLTREEMFLAFDHCRRVGILPLCTPFDAESVADLEAYGMVAYKIASADLTNPDLIEVVARTGKPMLLSTGMSDEAEIARAVNQLERLGAQYVLLHCNSTYPAPFKDVHLRYMDHLAQIGRCLVGYSGHERGYSVAVAAVARGAKVIEKHFTMDRNLEGNDHRVSLLPHEFKEMVQAIRDVEEALGSAETRRLTQGELMNRETLAKSLVATRDIRRGEVIDAAAIEVKSPGRGLAPYRRGELIGKAAVRDVTKGDFFFPEDLDATRHSGRAFQFRRPFGVPVRYHDMEAIVSKSNLDLVEFHLSYKDLDIDPATRIGQRFDMDFVVHSPELFSSDHLLDLASDVESYRKHSVGQLQRVVEVTRQLKPMFRTSRPMIIVNAGGFSADQAWPVGNRVGAYQRIGEALQLLDEQGVEVIIQTMPPFPWHFGGQRFHNLFVDAGEIARFCKQWNRRICLDVSHSKLACNHSQESFQLFLETVLPHTAHLHLVDAQGVDGEGLQIGSGDIDFVMLCRLLDQLAPSASFIPEVWQGHKADGAGFWEALSKLENFFELARDASHNTEIVNV